VCLSRRRSRGFWSKNLHESVPEHFVGSPFSTRRILVSADHRAIGDRRRFVDVYLEFPEDLRPAVLLRPVAKSVVHALPVPKSFGQIAPLDAGLRAEDDGINEQSIAAGRLSTLRTARQPRPQPCPLLVGQRMALHEQL